MDFKIAIAMATYNGNKYLVDQMDSILENMKPQDELWISDDGSTDGTWELLEHYEAADGRIHLLKGPGKGIKQNIACAIAACQGDYIFLTDQDDIWAMNKRQQVMETFLATGATLVVHDARVVKEDGKTTMYPSFFEYRNCGAGVWKNIWKNTYIGCCMAFCSELKSQILPIPDNIEMHDQWIGILNEKCLGKSVFIKEPLLNYRRHEDNTSSFSHYGWKKMLRNRLVLIHQLHLRKKKN